MANGASYEGDWVNDNCQGKGVYRFPNGAILDGDWSDCKFTVGRLTLADMAGTFEGTFTYIGMDPNNQLPIIYIMFTIRFFTVQMARSLE